MFLFVFLALYVMGRQQYSIALYKRCDIVRLFQVFSLVYIIRPFV